jgi:hypothetical protein
MKPILPSNGPGIVPHSDDNPSPDHMMLNFLKSLAKNAVQREVPHTLEELKAKKLSDLEIAIYLKEYQTAQDQYQRSKAMQALMFHDTLPHAPKKRATPQANKKSPSRKKKECTHCARKRFGMAQCVHTCSTSPS